MADLGFIYCHLGVYSLQRNMSINATGAKLIKSELESTISQ